MSLLFWGGGGTVGGGGGTELPLPVDLRIHMALGGSYRTWLKNRGTCVRHWFLGDVATIQARDEITDDASGDGVYVGEPSKGRGLLPEFGLSTTFTGTESVTISSGLSGIGGLFTIAALYRPSSTGMGTARPILHTGGTGSAYLGVNTDNEAVFGVYGSSEKVVGASLLVNRRYAVIGTYDGTIATIYVADLEANSLDSATEAMTFTAPHGAGHIGEAA
jgi:hypothetical protein